MGEWFIKESDQKLQVIAHSEKQKPWLFISGDSEDLSLRLCAWLNGAEFPYDLIIKSSFGPEHIRLEDGRRIEAFGPFIEEKNEMAMRPEAERARKKLIRNILNALKE